MKKGCKTKKKLPKYAFGGGSSIGFNAVNSVLSGMQDEEFMGKGANAVSGISDVIGAAGDMMPEGPWKWGVEGASTLMKLGTTVASKIKANNADPRYDQIYDPSQGLSAPLNFGDVAKYGGRLPKAQFGLPVQMNQDPNQVQEFHGPSHAQGGIPVDINKDGKPEMEVEGGETAANDYIYSDKIFMSKDGKISFDPKAGKSIADISKRIQNKYKGKTDKISLETKARELEVLKLKNEEGRKAMEQMQGQTAQAPGMSPEALPQFQTGGRLSQNKAVAAQQMKEAEAKRQAALQTQPYVNPVIQGIKSVFTPGSTTTPAPVQVPQAQIIVPSTRVKTQPSTGNVTDVTAKYKGPIQSTTPFNPTLPPETLSTRTSAQPADLPLYTSPSQQVVPQPSRINLSPISQPSGIRPFPTTATLPDISLSNVIQNASTYTPPRISGPLRSGYIPSIPAADASQTGQINNNQNQSAGATAKPKTTSKYKFDQSIKDWQVNFNKDYAGRYGTRILEDGKLGPETEGAKKWYADQETKTTDLRNTLQTGLSTVEQMEKESLERFEKTKRKTRDQEEKEMMDVYWNEDGTKKDMGKMVEPEPPKEDETKNNKFGLTSGDKAQLAGMATTSLYNIIKGSQKAEKEPRSRNPYGQQALNTLQNSRFNRAYQDNEITKAITAGKQGVRDGGRSVGAQQANLKNLAIAEMSERNKLSSQENQFNMQRDSQVAGMKMQLGEQERQETSRVNLTNAQNRGAQQAMKAAGFNSVGEMLSRFGVMQNTALSNKQGFNMLAELSQNYGFGDDYEAFLKAIKSGSLIFKGSKTLPGITEKKEETKSN